MMNSFYRTMLMLLVLAVPGLSACSASADSQELPAASADPVASLERWALYAPASSSSIPVILAAEELGNVDLTLYTSQDQANTLFARGEVDMVVTGLSVGVDLYRNEVPLQIVNTYVSGLSYLVTDGEALANFADLKGREVTVPFAGSPIEEVCRYLASQEGLEWGQDITPVYAPFESSIALLKQGQAGAVILPEPSVSLLQGQPGISVSFSLFDLWNQHNPGGNGYPQVGTFANRDWAESHAAEIDAFNAALAGAIAAAQSDPQAAVETITGSFKLPRDVLENALAHTHYQLYSGGEMQMHIQDYYQIIGKPLDEKYTQFYFIAEK
jgi:NitT/TauT family transport system substrate-binding protein